MDVVRAQGTSIDPSSQRSSLCNSPTTVATSGWLIEKEMSERRLYDVCERTPLTVGFFFFLSLSVTKGEDTA